MPFEETCVMEQRVRMLSEHDVGAFTVAALCRRYGISRETFYVWSRRRASGEAAWFEDRSHAALACPHRTPEAMAERLIAVRRRYPHFGPKKILAWLEAREPQAAWPAASTIGDILKRAGLVEPVRRRRQAVDQGRTFTPAVSPNEEWCADYKGWFRTGDGQRCDPLTITDAHSRYLIATQIAPETVEGAKAVFETAFKAHGLPLAIRSDNGSPFGSSGAAGLTRLSVWWLKLGIEPHFIQPASPQENGRHERMHRTLKQQTACPPAASPAEQQARFDAFRRHYNDDRPHEALEQTSPAQHWRPSPRAMPERLTDPWYDADHQTRRVRSSGEIKWDGGLIFVGEALVGELVGVAEIDDGVSCVRFCNIDLGLIDQRQRRFLRFAPLRHRLREPQEAQPNLSAINPVQSVSNQPG